MRRTAAGAMALAIALSAVPGVAQDKLTVFWGQSFYASEDDALDAAIRRFERKSGVKVELSQFADRDMIPKTRAALDSGSPPDIAYADSFDMQAAGRWAFDGRLEDISDIIQPLKPRFSPGTIETTFLYNDKTRKRAHYGFALKQQILHVHYWKDMLAGAGFKENDIPWTWKEHWAFWCDKVQPGLRKSADRPVFGIGSPMGVESTDSFLSFLTWADAYNVKLVDEQGKLLVDDPKVRAGLVNALRDYTDVYAKGCVPPSATSWKDADNDAAFNNRSVALTHGFAMAIATKWLDDANNTQLSRDQRAAGRRAYDDLIATAGLPRKPDGSAMTYRASVKLGVIFQESKNKARARDFLKFLLEEENLRPQVESALGRWFPVTKAGAESPFWQADKHRKAVYEQFKAGTLPFEFTRNYKFALLNSENVWAKAMSRVVTDKVPVDKAVDELIARIKQVAG